MSAEPIGFVDLHCHILPGFDDGANEMSESMAMVRMAVDEGISHIVATPHYMSQVFEPNPLDIEFQVSCINKLIAQQRMPVVVYPGAELYLDPEIPDLLKQNKILTINHGKYVLIELPRTGVPSYTEHVLFRIRLLGYYPIIAHPERNAAIMADPNVIKPLIEKGAMVQITAGAIVGEYGRRVRIAAERVLKISDCWVLGSDWHSGLARPAIFSEAIRRINYIVGNEAVNKNRLLASHILGINGRSL